VKEDKQTQPRKSKQGSNTIIRKPFVSHPNPSRPRVSKVTRESRTDERKSKWPRLNKVNQIAGKRKMGERKKECESLASGRICLLFDKPSQTVKKTFSTEAHDRSG